MVSRDSSTHTVIDVFSNQTQSQHYAKYRTNYPQPLMDRLHKISKGKKRYLDIAAGTGQLLFQLYPDFCELCVGNDLSATQLEMAKEHYHKISPVENPILKPRIEFIQSDAFVLEEELKRRNLQGKFDVITIGQALHWFDHYKLFDFLNSNLLEPDGVLCVLVYYQEGVVYTFGDEELKKRAHLHYDKFYFLVRPYFKSNQDSIYSGYADIDFSQSYKNVYKDSLVEGKDAAVEALIGYLKSWSGYQAYVATHSKEEGYVDPLGVLEKSLMDDINEYQIKSGEKVGSTPITILTPYYYYELTN